MGVRARKQKQKQKAPPRQWREEVFFNDLVHNPVQAGDFITYSRNNNQDKKAELYISMVLWVESSWNGKISWRIRIRGYGRDSEVDRPRNLLNRESYIRHPMRIMKITDSLPNSFKEPLWALYPQHDPSITEPLVKCFECLGKKKVTIDTGAGPQKAACCICRGSGLVTESQLSKHQQYILVSEEILQNQAPLAKQDKEKP